MGSTEGQSDNKKIYLFVCWIPEFEAGKEESRLKTSLKEHTIENFLSMLSAVRKTKSLESGEFISNRGGGVHGVKFHRLNFPVSSSAVKASADMHHETLF